MTLRRCSDAVGDVSEAPEVAEPPPVKWQLIYSRKRYGFDLYWGAYGLDRSASDLARLMIEYKERRIVDQFLDSKDDPMLLQTYLKAALPRILTKDALKIVTPFHMPSVLFAWLRRLAFVTDHEEFLRYKDDARLAMLRLQHAQSPGQWRTNHMRLAHANAQWAITADRYHLTWLNPYWVAHIREEMYHLLCADPINNLQQALDSAVRAAVTSIVCARQWANMLSDAGRDCDRPELRQWGDHLAAGIRGGDRTRYLTFLINDARQLSVSLRNSCDGGGGVLRGRRLRHAGRGA